MRLEYNRFDFAQQFRFLIHSPCLMILKLEHTDELTLQLFVCALLIDVLQRLHFGRFIYFIWYFYSFFISITFS